MTKVDNSPDSDLIAEQTHARSQIPIGSGAGGRVPVPPRGVPARNPIGDDLLPRAPQLLSFEQPAGNESVATNRESLVLLLLSFCKCLGDTTDVLLSEETPAGNLNGGTRELGRFDQIKEFGARQGHLISDLAGCVELDRHIESLVVGGQQQWPSGNPGKLGPKKCK